MSYLYVPGLNRKQVEAVKRIYDRGPLYMHVRQEGRMPTSQPYYKAHRKMTYREFRRLVEYSPACACVPWCGMWLAIEPDGYVHS